MNILVTGGAGYIGSHTAKALAQSGYRPVVIDDLSTGHAHNVKWGPLVRASLSDTAFVRTVLQECQIEAVIHFAGSALVGESARQPLSYFQNNVGGTLSLLQAMLDAGIKDIVFSSTCATYGSPARVPITEGQPQMPLNPYGDSTLSIERVIEWMGVAGQLRWVALRYFNAAGADPEGELGEEHEHETHLIPLAIGAALKQRESLQIFRRHGLDAGDPVDVPAEVGKAVEDHGGGENLALNLGTGKGASVLEVLEMVQLVGRQRVPATAVPRRAGDPPILVGDPQRARRILHWEPSHSALGAIVECAWRWHSRSQAQVHINLVTQS